MTTPLITRDLQHIWHPCSQMKDYQDFPPLIVEKAQGAYLYLENGQKVIDAISSWWCKSLGHNHPDLKQALLAQCERFEHVILANTTHETIVQLGEKLASLTANLDKCLFASDGSCAIEMAMKMSLHSRQLTGQHQRRHFLALSHGYHGETVGALSASDLGLYRQAYQSMLLDVEFIAPIPYVNHRFDPLWQDCSDYWESIEAQLNRHADTATAILFEPILQGAGGMKIYSQDFLRRLRAWSKAHDIHLIADEIMTGFGRTGLAFACQHANIEPDFMCLSKGLTSGWLPLSVTLTSTDMYQLFYDDYATGKAFLHSHTHTGNALAVSVALACLQVMEKENIYQQVRDKEPLMATLMQEVADNTGQLHNIRHIGAMVAADLISDQPRAGYQVYRQAVELGALLRPLGNTIYWLPPLNCEPETLVELKQITEQAINKSGLAHKMNLVCKRYFS